MSDASALLDTEALARQLPESPQAAFAKALQAARAGQVPAQMLLAQMYAEGKGNDADAALALLWYSVAASNGNALAMNMAGRCHELGLGTAADASLAAAWYRRAAEAGLDWGMYNYANLLATGRGGVQDKATALALYSKAAHMGHAKSMNLLARHLEEGWETARDRQAALAWYRRSAKAGDFRGQASYASILIEQGDIQQARHWLQLALAQGSPSFLAHIVPTLAASPHAPIRELVAGTRAGAEAPVEPVPTQAPVNPSAAPALSNTHHNSSRSAPGL